MKRAIALMMLVSVLGACQTKKEEKVFVPTPYPEDFAIVLDESKDTYYSRQDIRQVISADRMISATVYMILRDSDDTVATTFTQETPLNQTQLQNMWNEVQKNELFSKDYKPWYSWRTPFDDFKRSERRIQIRADGKLVEFKALNYFPNRVRELALQAQAVRLPITQEANLTATPGVPAPVKAPIPIPGEKEELKTQEQLPVPTAPAETPAAPEPAPAPSAESALEAAPETVTPAETPADTMPDIPE